MQLYKIRGGTEKELYDRKYNIGVAISLGNKWFTVKNIVEQVRWALPLTKEYVVVYVADSIHAINLEVRNKISSRRALRIAMESGGKMLEEVRVELERVFAKKDLNRVHFAKWNDLLTDVYKHKISYLYSRYEQDGDFREEIHSSGRSHTSKETKEFTEQDINKLGTDIIEELPEALCRVQIKGHEIDAYTYPFDSELPEFIENIQNKILFPEIKETILDTEPKVFLEVR